MINNQFNSSNHSASVSQNIAASPELTINMLAALNASGVADLNSQLAELRVRLFGESRAQQPANAIQQPAAPMPSVQGCLIDTDICLREAHAQVQHILGRI